MFNSILIETTNSLGLTSFLICTLTSLICGFIIAITYKIRNVYSKGFIISLVLLPAIVQMIIMMVNGNVGTGVAVAGAFSLVRFRSAPGSSKEITAIFLAMAVGLATGMGYVAFAIGFVLVICALFVYLNLSKFSTMSSREKLLKIMIPEDLDYEGMFDDLFKKYTIRHDLVRVRTTNMGSLYEIEYEVFLRQGIVERQFINELRCRNGNLNISLGRTPVLKTEL